VINKHIPYFLTSCLVLTTTSLLISKDYLRGEEIIGGQDTVTQSVSHLNELTEKEYDDFLQYAKDYKPPETDTLFTRLSNEYYYKLTKREQQYVDVMKNKQRKNIKQKEDKSNLAQDDYYWLKGSRALKAVLSDFISELLRVIGFK